MAYGTVNVPQKEQNITVDAALSSTSTNPVQNKVVQAALALKAALNHAHAAATTTADGFMSAADKVKLDGIAAGANKYTHPAYTAKSAGLYKVTVDSTGHVSAAAAVSKADITALGIPAKDTAYTHPTYSGYKHIPSGGSSGQILRWSADGTAAWGAESNVVSAEQIKQILLQAHPVGSYYWSSDSTSPATLFGGTWTQVKDRFVYAAGSKTAGTTGGEENHTLLEAELPNIQGDFGCAVPYIHSGWRSGVFVSKTIGYSGNQAPNIENTAAGNVYGYEVDFGQNQSHNNMPPYIVAYCWRRTA